jgi:hypothetical protein
MAWLKFINNIYTPFSTDDNIVRADFLNACTHFHADHCSFSVQMTHCLIILRFAIGDSSLSKIVRGQLNRYAITWYDADIMFPHLTCDVSYYLMAVLKLDSKLSTREGLNHCPRQLDDFLICNHKYNKGNYIS